MKVIHPFKPIYNQNSKILILGSFPSIKSREDAFYYSHPQNRFWKVLEKIYHEKIENSKEGKTTFLLRHQIAIWDSIYSCEIENSEDASIKNAVANDLSPLLKNSSIEKIFCNGNASYQVFQKYYCKKNLLPVKALPSTSPANARYSLEKLVQIWGENLLD